MDSSLLDYLSRGFIQIELNEVIMGTQHRLIGIGRIPLLQLLSSLGIAKFYFLKFGDIFYVFRNSDIIIVDL